MIKTITTLTFTAALLAGPTYADYGDRVENHADRKGDRIDRGLTQRGERFDNRWDRRH